jgi:hypothetical protein
VLVQKTTAGDYNLRGRSCRPPRATGSEPFDGVFYCKAIAPQRMLKVILDTVGYTPEGFRPAGDYLTRSTCPVMCAGTAHAEQREDGRCEVLDAGIGIRTAGWRTARPAPADPRDPAPALGVVAEHRRRDWPVAHSHEAR